MKNLCIFNTRNYFSRYPQETEKKTNNKQEVINISEVDRRSALPNLSLRVRTTNKRNHSFWLSILFSAWHRTLRDSIEIVLLPSLDDSFSYNLSFLEVNLIAQAFCFQMRVTSLARPAFLYFLTFCLKRKKEVVEIRKKWT